ncbi:MAG TPA: hypothetical protein VI356_11920 [Myxococcales bacterium]
MAARAILANGRPTRAAVLSNRASNMREDRFVPRGIALAEQKPMCSARLSSIGKHLIVVVGTYFWADVSKTALEMANPRRAAMMTASDALIQSVVRLNSHLPGCSAAPKPTRQWPRGANGANELAARP